MFQTYCRNSLSYHHYPQYLLINIGTILRTYLCKISKEHYKNASRLRPKRRSLSRPRHESANMIARQHSPSLPVTITTAMTTCDWPKLAVNEEKDFPYQFQNRLIGERL